MNVHLFVFREKEGGDKIGMIVHQFVCFSGKREEEVLLQQFDKERSADFRPKACRGKDLYPLFFFSPFFREFLRECFWPCLSHCNLIGGQQFDC